MTTFEANLDALGPSHPAVAVLRGAPGPDRGQWSLSRTGLPVARISGVSLASAFDPRAEALRAVPGWGPDVDFALVPGLGLGYLVEAVVARYPDLPVVVAEPDPAWAREVLSHRDLSEVWALRQVTFVVNPDPAAVGQFFDSVACRTVGTVPWRPLEVLNPRWSADLGDQVAGAQARGRVNGATFERFGALWKRNLVKNLQHARDVRPVSALAGTGRGRPAVIAAAGPSLNEALGWLETHRDRFVLVAVDTAWPTLAHHGIVPDLLVVLDGQYWNSRHVDPPVPGSTAVVTEWVGPPRAFRLAPGRTFVAGSSVPFLRRWESQAWGDLGALPSGGSVATAAWSLVLGLGCPEVAFVGLDLGYPKGQTHAAGSQFEEAIHRRSFRLGPAETRGLGLRDPALTGRPGVGGDLVLSDRRMDLYRDWLSRSVEAHPEIAVFNLSARGSLIRGLQAPFPDYGSHWKPLPPWNPPSVPALVRRPASTPVPPPTSGPLEQVWEAVRQTWGAEVWDPWAGRAWATWKRFPSPRSLRAVHEALALASRWADFVKDL